MTTGKLRLRHAVLIAACVGLLALAKPIYYSGILFGLWQPLIRPQGVPRSAHYVSLVEEGTWFECYLDARRNVDVCRAWDAGGRPIVRGDFSLEGENRAATEAELRPSHVVRGNNHVYMIYLFGTEGAFSKALVPVTDTVPPTVPKTR